MMIKIPTVVIFIGIMSSSTLAYSFNPGKNGDNCSKYINLFEKKYQIPKNLLKAISYVESGYYDRNKQLNAWAWTVANGKIGMHFDTLKQAINYIKRLQKKNEWNIDVGCMQINLHYHGSNFNNLQDAFNPYKNVEYSAQLLSRLYKKYGSWGKAIQYYHSATPKLQKRYLKLIKNSYSHINNRVFNAKHYKKYEINDTNINTTTTTTTKNTKTAKATALVKARPTPKVSTTSSIPKNPNTTNIKWSNNRPLYSKSNNNKNGVFLNNKTYQANIKNIYTLFNLQNTKNNMYQKAQLTENQKKLNQQIIEKLSIQSKTNATLLSIAKKAHLNEDVQNQAQHNNVDNKSNSASGQQKNTLNDVAKKKTPQKGEQYKIGFIDYNLVERLNKQFRRSFIHNSNGATLIKQKG